MKRLFLVALSLTVPLAAMAQTTVFSDNFTTDASLGSSWYNLNDSTTSSSLFTAGSGWALTSSASGHVVEGFTQFSPSLITLGSVGDYLTLSVTFTGTGIAANTGGLLVGLYDPQGTPPNGDEVGTSGSTATTGATADDSGYFGLMGFNTSAGTSTKFYSRNTGVANAQNELGYYSRMLAAQYTQQKSVAASLNANLSDSTAYTLVYNITKGASGNTITATINQGVNLVESWSYTDAGLNSSFDELDFGFYNKNGASLSGNLTEVTVTDFIQSVPEPSTFALAGLGLFGLTLVRRFRR